MLLERSTLRSGVRIRYLTTPPDPAGSVPVLLAPGLSDLAEEYAQTAEFFAPRQLIVVEVRGRGGSDAPPSGYVAAAHAADLRAVVDEEALDRFHLMTFSRGTTWGLDLALSDPARVATVSIGDYWAAEKHLGPDAAEQLLATRFRGRPLPERIPPHVVRELFGASVQRDLLDQLAATGLPVLVATGTEPGCLLDAEAIRRYRERLPSVEVVVIEGAGHDLFRPDRLAYPRAVAAHIGRSESSGLPPRAVPRSV